MKLLTLLGMMFVAASAQAAEHQHHMPPPTSACTEARLACADKAAPFVGADGTLWVIWSANGRVAVESSRDQGRTFSPPVFVNRAVEKLDSGPDSRPQLVVDGQGNIVVAYTIARDASYNGQVFTAVSRDGAKSFDAPQPLTEGKASQRFVAFALDQDGDLFTAWIDKRNLAAAKAAGKDYAGAALAFSWAKDAHFALARIALDNTCECCRIAVALAAPHRPAVMWRNIFPGGVRDHALMTFNGDRPGPIARVATDNWQTDACPHQGPSLAISTSGAYHATWFTEGAARQGLFYARSADGGRTFSTPIAIGDVEQQPSRPYILAASDGLWMVWKEFDGEHATVLAMRSLDDGLTWSAGRKVANTADASDHPLLISLQGHAFLSWLTRAEGYRLIPLEAP